MAQDRFETIRDRAYHLWEAEGRPEGRHEHHWREASRQIGDEMMSQGGTDAQGRPGALDGGLVQMGGLVAGGGPAGVGLGGLGLTEEEDETAQQR